MVFRTALYAPTGEQYPANIFPYLVPNQSPGEPDQGLCVALAFVTVYDKMKVEPVVLPDHQPAEVKGFKNPGISPSGVPDSILRAFMRFASFFVTRTLYRNFHKKQLFCTG